MFYSDLNNGTSRWGTRTQILNSQENVRLSAADGDATFAGTVQAGSYKCRAGIEGEYGNVFNIFWGSQVQIWIDNSQIVTLSPGTYSPTSLYFDPENQTLFGSNLELHLDPDDPTKILDVKESIRTMQSALYRLKAAVLIPDTSVDQLRLRILEALETITEEV